MNPKKFWLKLCRPTNVFSGASKKSSDSHRANPIQWLTNVVRCVVYLSNLCFSRCQKSVRKPVLNVFHKCQIVFSTRLTFWSNAVSIPGKAFPFVKNYMVHLFLWDANGDNKITQFPNQNNFTNFCDIFWRCCLCDRLRRNSSNKYMTVEYAGAALQ